MEYKAKDDFPRLRYEMAKSWLEMCQHHRQVGISMQQSLGDKIKNRVNRKMRMENGISFAEREEVLQQIREAVREAKVLVSNRNARVSSLGMMEKEGDALIEETLPGELKRKNSEDHDEVSSKEEGPFCWETLKITPRASLAKRKVVINPPPQQRHQPPHPSASTSDRRIDVSSAAPANQKPASASTSPSHSRGYQLPPSKQQLPPRQQYRLPTEKGYQPLEQYQYQPPPLEQYQLPMEQQYQLPMEQQYQPPPQQLYQQQYQLPRQHLYQQQYHLPPQQLYQQWYKPAYPYQLPRANFHLVRQIVEPLFPPEELEPITASEHELKPKESSQEKNRNELQAWKDEYEKKDDYSSLVALSDVGLVTNFEVFDCPICFTEVAPGKGAMLHECLHSFCRECLAGTIQHSDTAIIRCPFGNENYLCESNLQDREIRCLVTPEMYEKHLARSLALAENQARDSFHCKTPDCPGWCLFDDNVNVFVCPVCKKTNCLTCGAVHEGRNCRQYKDWLELENDSSKEAKETRQYLKDMVVSDRAMECPVCKAILTKVSGCDLIKCSLCRTDVCWATKKTRWGPMGPGDTSGGCNCMVNFVRCSPKCMGCH